MVVMCDYAKIKAEILCWGLRKSPAAENIFLEQHPTLHKRTGNAGIQLLLESGLVLNAIYGEDFCEKSPYHIEKENGSIRIYKNRELVCICAAIKAPEWYAKRTRGGYFMADIILQEGRDTLITGIWNNCCYYQNGTQCRFCVFGYEKGIERKSIGNIVETLQAALKEKSGYHLHMTGGNTFGVDRGIQYYQDYIKKIRGTIIASLPISLEVSPPEDIKYLDDIIDSGVNGFSINIEVWDEERRKEICPGKSKIKRDDYFKAWRRVSERLGRFTSSSVIIVGLDRAENIEEGIKELVKMGIKPTLIPFRPFGRCDLKDLPSADPKEFFELSMTAGKLLAEAGAESNSFLGCEHCGACSLEKDLM